MSGGVDSSVAAARLVAAGHDVVGATLQLWGGESDIGLLLGRRRRRRAPRRPGARRRPPRLQLRRGVRAPRSWRRTSRRTRAGLTPNPCVECNRPIKFDLLVERARGAWASTRVATGHHARVVWRAGRATLARGADAAKDQSYVLGFLGRAALASTAAARSGTSSKAEVRAEAARSGLRTWDKPDSQDVCFIAPSRGRAGFLARAHRADPGAASSTRDRRRARRRADAAELVTVGQRRGIAPRARRRGALRHARRRGRRARRGGAAATDVARRARSSSTAARSPCARRAGDGRSPVLAQWSAHGTARAATLVAGPSGRLDLAEPARPVAPGQTVVLYRADDPRPRRWAPRWRRA